MASALMKLSKFCPLYMASAAALTSPQTDMTHLSWDAAPPGMLGPVVRRHEPGKGSTALENSRMNFSTFRLVLAVSSVAVALGGPV
ncbi:MAG: hypothetical protein ACK46T_17180, partial [Bradyrhizobium sp.]